VGQRLCPLALSLASVAGLVASDVRRSLRGRYLFKPVAAMAFIWLALAVAQRQFVGAARATGLWGTPLCFASQMLIASSLAYH